MYDLMPDLETTIQALKSCSKEDGICVDSECPYSSVCTGYGTPAMRNAIILLEALKLSEQEKQDLEIIHRIRERKSLKVVNGAYTIVNEAWRKENPWVLPQEAVEPIVEKNISSGECEDPWGRLFFCGACGKRINEKYNPDEDDKFCKHCGRAVKWG
ncbi:MAG: hypothetical protein IKF99_11870 [Oscillospiraceae bacterium]|nr:hypothetical protein [Oscillospiraceae bacterium]